MVPVTYRADVELVLTGGQTGPRIGNSLVLVLVGSHIVFSGLFVIMFGQVIPCNVALVIAWGCAPLHGYVHCFGALGDVDAVPGDYAITCATHTNPTIDAFWTSPVVGWDSMPRIIAWFVCMGVDEIINLEHDPWNYFYCLCET